MVDSADTTFYLIRHGEALINVRTDLWELSDCSLTEHGRAQATSLGQRLSSQPLDIIYASTMRRARETAEIVAQATHVPIVYADWLREMNFGDFDRLSLDDIKVLYPGLLDTGKHSWEQGCPGGETIRSFYERVVSGLKELLSVSPLPQHIALVAHAGSLEVALNYLLELPLIPTDRFVIDNASLSIVRLRRIAGETLPQLVVHNDTSHCPAAAR